MQTASTLVDTSLSSSSSDYRGKKEWKSKADKEMKGKRSIWMFRKNKGGRKAESLIEDSVCDAHRSVNIHDHLSSSLVAFTVVGPFLFLLQHAVSGGSILKRKLAEDLTEPVNTDLSHAVGGVTQEQQERMEPGGRGRRGGDRKERVFKVWMFSGYNTCLCKKVL